MYYIITGFILGLYWDNGKENGNYYSLLGYILGLYWGYIGIMENKMEATIVCSYQVGILTYGLCKTI